MEWPNSRLQHAETDLILEFFVGWILHQELDPSLEPILAKNVIDNGGGTLSLKAVEYC